MDLQLKLLIEGDRAAFGDLFAQHYPRTNQYFRKRTGCAEQAADLTQQCFLRLWQYHASLSPVHPIEQQLFVIARSLLLNHLEKRSVADRAKLELLQQKESSSSFQIEAESSDYITTAFRTLPASEKNVLQLKFLKGYSNKEISGELSISVKTVEARISSAYKKLKSILSTPFI